MRETVLGKIEKATFGIGGYNESELGLFLEFSFDGCGTATSRAFWSPSKVKHSEHCKWTEKDRDNHLIGLARFVDETLHEAKVKSVEDLKGIPVEIEIRDNTLKNWRVLTEVL